MTDYSYPRFAASTRVDHVQFSVRRLKPGYDEIEVDNYLDTVKHTLKAYERFEWDVRTAIQESRDIRGARKRIGEAVAKLETNQKDQAHDTED